MRHESFAALILTHGRAERVFTYDTIRRHGYTGRIILVIDNEDETADQYHAEFPDDEIVVFDKRAVWERIDNYTNDPGRRAIVYARNASFDIAESLGLTHFVQLDDDYTSFHHRVKSDGGYLPSCNVHDLDAVFDVMLDWLDEGGFLSVAMAQGGDLLSGGKTASLNFMMRKAMNSFFCRTDRRFKFEGQINEDVNAYVGLGGCGGLFGTVSQVHLNQVQTQSSDGGMTALYLDGGTYRKSFNTVLANPSCVRIGVMGPTSPRLHHKIDWNRAVPKIVSEEHRKR